MPIPIFEENKTHTTYINKKGIIVPSVTTILKMINKEELLYWANSLGYKHKSVKNELEMSAYIGTVTHELVEIFMNTQTYDISKISNNNPVEKICIRNAFTSFLQLYAKERLNLIPINTELQLSGKRFGGTLDLLATYKDKLTLCDYKTSKDFYPTMFLQMAGYDILLRELFNKKVESYMIILLDKKNGNTAKTKIVSDKDEMKEYRICFKKLLLFYYDWISINNLYWK